MIRRCVRRFLFRLFVSRFVPGETYDEAIPRIRALTKQGYFVTLDLLGETVNDRESAKKFVSEYIEVLKRLYKEELLDVNISVKPTMLWLLIDEDFFRENLEKLLRAAKSHYAFVRIDMEDPKVTLGPNNESLTDATLRIVESFLPEFKENIGVVLQAHLHRTEADAEKWTGLGIRIRLCKGAYKTSEDFAYQDRDKVRHSYICASRHMIRSGYYPAFATHDEFLVEWIKEFGRRKSTFEFQTLFGIRSSLAKSLLAEGHNVRIYMPIGQAWWPYFKRRLKEGKPHKLILMFAQNIFNQRAGR